MLTLGHEKRWDFIFSLYSLDFPNCFSVIIYQFYIQKKNQVFFYIHRHINTYIFKATGKKFELFHIEFVFCLRLRIFLFLGCLCEAGLNVWRWQRPVGIPGRGGSTGRQYCSYQKEDSNSRSRFNLSWNTYCPMWRSVTDSRLRGRPGCFSGVKERTRKLVAAKRGKYLLICSFACPSPLEGLKARPIIGGKIIIIKNTYYTHIYSAC